MNNRCKHGFLIIAMIGITMMGLAQSGKISIKFIGNSGFYMTDGSKHLCVDFPYKSGAHRYMEYSSSELDSIPVNSVLLFTHRHADHYSKKLLKKLTGKAYGNWNVSELEELNEPEFSIQTFKTSHKFTFKHYSYLITWHNKKIYISGDTGNAEPMSKIENIDWVLAPFWVYRNAQDQNILIDTKMYGICHLYPTQKIGEGFPENVHFFTKQNEVITISY